MASFLLDREHFSNQSFMAKNVVAQLQNLVYILSESKGVLTYIVFSTARCTILNFQTSKEIMNYLTYANYHSHLIKYYKLGL